MTNYTTPIKPRGPVAYAAVPNEKNADTYRVVAFRKRGVDDKRTPITMCMTMNVPDEVANIAQALQIETPNAKEAAELIASALNAYYPMRSIDWVEGVNGWSGLIKGKLRYYIQAHGVEWKFDGVRYDTLDNAKVAVWKHHVEMIAELFEG